MLTAISDKRGRERNKVSQDRRHHLVEMSATKPDAKAAKAFIRKAYECCDVLGYMANKYDIKGEIGIGENDIRKDQGIP
ncbi:hypothetical protein AALD22_23570 [Lachnospiraceae bacterium 56-18]